MYFGPMPKTFNGAAELSSHWLSPVTVSSLNWTFVFKLRNSLSQSQLNNNNNNTEQQKASFYKEWKSKNLFVVVVEIFWRRMETDHFNECLRISSNDWKLAYNF